MMYTAMPSAYPPQELMLPLDRISPRPSLHDARGSASLQGLAGDIRQHGLCRPVLVRRRGNGRYMIVSGNRRLLACRMLGVTAIRARVMLDDTGWLTQEQLLEMLLGHSMHYLEEARVLRALQEAHGFPRQTLAELSGLNMQTLSAEMKLADLDDDIRALLMDEEAPMAVALTLLPLHDAGVRMEAARRITRERLCVRDAALLVGAMARLHHEKQGVNKQEGERNPKHTGRVIGVIRDQRPYINALRDIAGQMQAAGIRTTVSEELHPGRMEMTISISTRRRRAARYQSM